MTVYLSRIVLNALRNPSSKNFVLCSCTELTILKGRHFSSKNDIFNWKIQTKVRKYSSDMIAPPIALENANIPIKKKIIHKKAVLEELSQKEGHYVTMAYATANSYDLKALKDALVAQKLYEPGSIQAQEIGDVVVANAVYSVEDEPRQILFFREGAVVFWNCTQLEASNVLDFVKRYEQESYPREVVLKEREVMTYFYQPNIKKCHLQDQESCFVMVPNTDNSLEKYTFSHAMAQSARLGAWEARLESLAADVSYHTARMRTEGIANVDKKEVVRKLGELFALRHTLNVESDLLDGTPDVYWEQEQLEKLYSNTVAYFTIPRRTRVLNERLAHCVELLELLSSWAADRHHVRLEWMVIALILAEVCFELLHYYERSMDRGARQAGSRRGISAELEQAMLADMFLLDTFG
ncbi:required for meiotic nuclear division protein 1 homolog isoform X2 [Plodia interpunctella]|uniref:required for meiotic nuclear division protein 1 homolog isoform X2 n=1 Tax=Plodia interpunctella TaxID=58824 RepID=UPI002368168E|nr:required for meiotic nuclear division protein 1 homolog isoform X2 [Plodia interpunctella]